MTFKNKFRIKGYPPKLFAIAIFNDSLSNFDFYVTLLCAQYDKMAC